MGANEDDLRALRSILTDEELNSVSDSMGMKGVVLNVEPFAQKVGFTRKENAFRAAKAKDLITSSMPLADARGRTLDPGGNVILNPISEDLVVAPGSRARVRFMTPAQLMEWLSGCNTPNCQEVRRGLAWFYAMHERERELKEIDELTAELADAHKTIEEKDDALAELVAILQEHKEAELKRRRAITPGLFKIYRNGSRIVPMKRQPTTLAPRIKVLQSLGFSEIPDIPTHPEAGKAWDQWHKVMKKKGLSQRSPVPYRKDNTARILWAYKIDAMTPAALEDTLTGLTPWQAEWMRKVVNMLDGVVDVSQSTMDEYMVPIYGDRMQ
jgi:hypothetical protein